LSLKRQPPTDSSGGGGSGDPSGDPSEGPDDDAPHPTIRSQKRPDDAGRSSPPPLDVAALARQVSCLPDRPPPGIYLPTSLLTPLCVRQVTLEELKLEMQCKTDVKPHGADGQVVLDAVRAQLEDIAGARDGGAGVVRVFGTRLLEELRQAMVDRTQVHPRADHCHTRTTTKHSTRTRTQHC
jgi:hypothetical protein